MDRSMQFTREEIAFLVSQKVALSQVFDATGMSTDEARKAAKENECNVVFGGTPCRKHGHRLRTRSGSCIQCDTAQLGFQLRETVKNASVYVAASYKKRLFKIGLSNLVERRIKVIQAAQYGGASDWEAVLLVNGDHPSAIEYGFHKRLEKWNIEGSYVWNGRTQACRELFSCSYDEIKNVAESVSEDSGARLIVASNEKRLREIYNY